MGLKDRLGDAVKSRIRGRVAVDSRGQKRYFPPGHRVKDVGDGIATFGTLGYILPFFGAAENGYTEGVIPTAIYPEMEPQMILLTLVFLPLATIPIVVLMVYLDRPAAKLGLLTIGIAWTVFTYPLTSLIFSVKSTGPAPLLGLLFGSWLILLGGCLALPSLYFIEWAKQYDDNPKRV